MMVPFLHHLSREGPGLPRRANDARRLRSLGVGAAFLFLSSVPTNPQPLE